MAPWPVQRVICKPPPGVSANMTPAGTTMRMVMARTTRTGAALRSTLTRPEMRMPRFLGQNRAACPLGSAGAVSVVSGGLPGQTVAMPNPAPGGPTRRRADAVLAERGLASSRARARAAIEAGGVTADGRQVTRASDLIAAEAEITFRPAFEEVSRAAGKLKAAPGFDGAPLEGAVVLDVGASTGGFTEVCLGRGARRVFAVDVGRGQLHPRLRADPRVVSLEGLDARRLDAALVTETPDVVVCDASFIGLAKVLPAALDLARPGAWLFALVKPQFEVGPERVGKGGVVRDPVAREDALQSACDFLEASGWRVTGRAPSPVTGADGNLEFLVTARKA